jgi:hypothetical protein
MGRMKTREKLTIVSYYSTSAENEQTYISPT